MRNKRRQLHFVVWFFCFFISLTIVRCSVSLTEETYWYSPITSHRIIELDGLSPTWARGEVFIRDDDLSPMMSASQGILFMLGGLSQDDKRGITALDADSGEAIWQSDTQYRAALYTTPTNLYVGHTGNAGVTSLDLRTGKVKWETPLHGSRGFGYLYVFGNELFVQTSATQDKFFILEADSGEIIQEIEGYSTFLITDSIAYRRSIISSIFLYRTNDVKDQS